MGGWTLGPLKPENVKILHFRSLEKLGIGGGCGVVVGL